MNHFFLKSIILFSFINSSANAYIERDLLQSQNDVKIESKALIPKNILNTDTPFYTTQTIRLFAGKNLNITADSKVTNYLPNVNGVVLTEMQIINNSSANYSCKLRRYVPTFSGSIQHPDFYYPEKNLTFKLNARDTYYLKEQFNYKVNGIGDNNPANDQRYTSWFTSSYTEIDCYAD